MIQKSHIWNSFSENILSDIQSFYICPDVPVDIIRVFLISDFLDFLKSQSQQKVAKKITHTFYNTVLLKNTSLILRTSAHLTLKVIFSNTTFLTLQILQTCFCLVSEQIFVLHHFLTPKNCILEAH